MLLNHGLLGSRFLRSWTRRERGTFNSLYKVRSGLVLQGNLQDPGGRSVYEAVSYARVDEGWWDGILQEHPRYVHLD